MKVCIVHDWLYGGGAELVIEELHKMYPQAPIYTSFCTDEWRERLDGVVKTGYLQRWPFAPLRKFLPILRQRWFSQLDLSAYDLVISSSGNGEAKFVGHGLKKLGTGRPVHICYCHTPPHFYWRKYQQYLNEPGFRPVWLARLGLRLLVKPLRKRDYAAAQTVDHFIANSHHIQNDIKQFYGRDSAVIYPPVDIDRFKLSASSTRPSRNGFVMWGRHVPYKRFDLAIQACNQLKLPLTVIGSGPATESLKKLAGPTVKVTGRVSSQELVDCAHSAQAFIFPGEEDFGIAPVEALAAGLPIIAYKSGGALDFVKPGVTGEFFADQTVASLVKQLRSFAPSGYNRAAIQKTSLEFSQESFVDKFSSFVNNLD